MAPDSCQRPRNGSESGKGRNTCWVSRVEKKQFSAPHAEFTLEAAGDRRTSININTSIYIYINRKCLHFVKFFLRADLIFQGELGGCAFSSVVPSGWCGAGNANGSCFRMRKSAASQNVSRIPDPADGGRPKRHFSPRDFRRRFTSGIEFMAPHGRDSRGVAKSSCV